MDRRAWPTGIRPCPTGIRIRLWRHRKVIHTETVKGDAYSARDLAAAVKRRKWLESRLTLGLPVFEGDESETTTFQVAAQSYLNTLDAKHSTHISYENILNQYWIPTIGDWPLHEVSAGKIKDVVAALSLSPKTKKNILIPARGVFDAAEVSPNPCAGIKSRKRQKIPVERYTPQQRTSLLNALSGQSLVYFALLFGCGLRPCGEPLALRWTDYDGEELDISKQITKRRLEPSTKTSVRRRVYVPTWVRSILNEHPTRFQGSYIFMNSKGGPFLDTDTFNADWKAAHKKARIPYRIPYTCRHTRASELLSIGIDPADAAKQLGHSIEMFLRIYAEFIEEFSRNKDKSRFEGVGIDQKKKVR